MGLFPDAPNIVRSYFHFGSTEIRLKNISDVISSSIKRDFIVTIIIYFFLAILSEHKF